MYRWVEHTAELELQIDAPTEEQVFVDAAAALAELADGSAPSGRELREIELAGEERDLLLADWLNELVYLADADGFVPVQVVSLTLDGAGLRATVSGSIGRPRPLVKAVSLHGLEVRAEADGSWHARLVLDV